MLVTFLTCSKKVTTTCNHMSKAAWDYAQAVIHDPEVMEANRKLFE